MIHIEIIKKGLLTTIQDMGRHGLAYYAIPQSGVMDKSAAQTANLLVGNQLTQATIECHLLAPSIQFHHDAIIAITGADMNWTINNQPVLMMQKLHVPKNSILSGSMSANGMRAYIAIQGKPKTSTHFNSYATYPPANLGANDGKYLMDGDTIDWDNSSVNRFQISSVKTTENKSYNKKIVQIHQGPEFNYMDQSSKQKLIEKTFTIQIDSNRMGARLKGPELHADQNLLESRAILPGMIQLLPSGQLIVILNDGQTTGGYPRIGYISEDQLSGFNQISFNSPFQFSLKG